MNVIKVLNENEKNVITNNDNTNNKINKMMAILKTVVSLIPKIILMKIPNSNFKHDKR